MTMIGDFRNIPPDRLMHLFNLGSTMARRDVYAKLQKIEHRGLRTKDLAAIWGPNSEVEDTDSGLELWRFHPSDFHLIAIVRDDVCLGAIWEYLPVPSAPSLEHLHREFLALERWNEAAEEVRNLGMKAHLESSL